MKAKIHLVAAMSSYVRKVSDWVSEVVQLAKFAQTRGRDLLEPLENAISLLLVVAITKRNCNQPD